MLSQFFGASHSHVSERDVKGVECLASDTADIRGEQGALDPAGASQSHKDLQKVGPLLERIGRCSGKGSCYKRFLQS